MGRRIDPIEMRGLSLDQYLMENPQLLNKRQEQKTNDENCEFKKDLDEAMERIRREKNERHI